MACEELFLRSLRDRGFRLTPQREMVLAALHQTDSPVTADDLYQKVQQVSTSVDISTVYRTLDLLQSLDFVTSMDVGDAQRMYELSTGHGHHAHLVCRRCGAITGVGLDQFESLSASIRQQHGFQIDLDNLSFVGQCAQCYT